MEAERRVIWRFTPEAWWAHTPQPSLWPQLRQGCAPARLWCLSGAHLSVLLAQLSLQPFPPLSPNPSQSPLVHVLCVGWCCGPWTGPTHMELPFPRSKGCCRSWPIAGSLPTSHFLQGLEGPEKQTQPETMWRQKGHPVWYHGCFQPSPSYRWFQNQTAQAKHPKERTVLWLAMQWWPGSQLPPRAPLLSHPLTRLRSVLQNSVMSVMSRLCHLDPWLGLNFLFVTRISRA